MAGSRKSTAGRPVDETEVALRSGRVGTWHWDLRKERVSWSGNMEAIHGMPAGTFDGTVAAFQSTIHPDDLERVKAAIGAALDGRGDYHVEYRNIGDDASEFWLTARGQVLRDASGAAVGMAGVCMDVTERKEAELRLSTQYAVTRLLNESENLATVAPELLCAICRASGWDIGELWRWDPDRQVLRIEGQWYADSIADHDFRNAMQGALFEPGKGLPGRVWSSGEASWVLDVQADPHFVRKELARHAGLQGAFGFPIHSGRNMTGVMLFLSRRAREPDVQLLDMFDALGGQIGNVIERREAETALRRRAEQQTVVAQLGQRALARPDLEEFLPIVVERIAGTLEVEFVEILELQADGTFLLRSGCGWNAGLEGEATVPGGRDSQAGYTLESSVPVIVTDLHAETRFNGPPLLFDHGVISGITTVIHGRGRAYGVLGAHTRRRRKFTDDDTNFLQAVANVLAMSIESRHAEETIRRLSTPILPLHEHMLILPVIGAIDMQRVEQLADQLLTTIRQNRAKVVVIDTTGAALLEPEIVQHLVRTAEAARLLGAKIIMTGISNEIGRALVAAGVDRSQITSLADLRSGVEEAQRLLKSLLSNGSERRAVP